MLLMDVVKGSEQYRVTVRCYISSPHPLSLSLSPSLSLSHSLSSTLSCLVINTFIIRPFYALS